MKRKSSSTKPAKSSTMAAAKRRSNGDLGAWLNLSVERNPFVCSRCPKAFPSLHALGGHQNGHRKEIEEEDRRSEDQERKPKSDQETTKVLSPEPLSVAPPAGTDHHAQIFAWYQPTGFNYGPHHAHGFMPGLAYEYPPHQFAQDHVSYANAIPSGDNYGYQNHFHPCNFNHVHNPNRHQEMRDFMGVMNQEDGNRSEVSSKREVVDFNLKL